MDAPLSAGYVAGMADTCQAPDCDKPARARGLCVAHYRRQVRQEAGESAPEPEAPIRARDMVRFSLRLPRAVWRALKDTAADQGVSVYRVIGDILEAWEKKRRRK